MGKFDSERHKSERAVSEGKWKKSGNGV